MYLNNHLINLKEWRAIMSDNNVLIINRDDILFLKPLDMFLKKNHKDISQIYFTNFFPPQANKSNYIKKSLKIMGKRYFAKYLSVSMVKKLVQMFLPIKKFSKRASLPLLAKHYKLPCREILDINSDAFIAELKYKKVNNILSITSQLYDDEILHIENLNIYNFHPSLLPKNKGRFPLFWAVMNKDKQGITCHEIIKEIDAGKIIHQKVIDCHSNSIPKIMETILLAMPNFMDEAFTKIKDKNISAIGPLYDSFYGPTPNNDSITAYKRLLKRCEK